MPAQKSNEQDIYGKLSREPLLDSESLFLAVFSLFVRPISPLLPFTSVPLPPPLLLSVLLRYWRLLLIYSLLHLTPYCSYGWSQVRPQEPSFLHKQ